MSDRNICSDLEIVDITVPTPFSEMYGLQRSLQLRLNSDAYLNESPIEMSKRCIYWFYCIASETKELMDWFNPKNHGTLSLQDVEKEIQMEAIDVLHFVMNIGLELWVEDSKLEEWANSIPEDILPPMPDKCNMACAYLITKCITLIDCMPWKSWKGYDLLTIEDYRSLLLEDYGNAYKMALVLAGHTGLSKQAIVNLYFAKNKENHDRQTRGY